VENVAKAAEPVEIAQFFSPFVYHLFTRQERFSSLLSAPWTTKPQEANGCFLSVV
jgi:hypothetical protein